MVVVVRVVVVEGFIGVVVDVSVVAVVLIQMLMMKECPIYTVFCLMIECH